MTFSLTGAQSSRGRRSAAYRGLAMSQTGSSRNPTAPKGAGAAATGKAGYYMHFLGAALNHRNLTPFAKGATVGSVVSYADKFQAEALQGSREARLELPLDDGSRERLLHYTDGPDMTLDDYRDVLTLSCPGERVHNRVFCTFVQAAPGRGAVPKGHAGGRGASGQPEELACNARDAGARKGAHPKAPPPQRLPAAEVAAQLERRRAFEAALQAAQAATAAAESALQAARADTAAAEAAWREAYAATAVERRRADAAEAALREVAAAAERELQDAKRAIDRGLAAVGKRRRQA